MDLVSRYFFGNQVVLIFSVRKEDAAKTVVGKLRLLSHMRLFGPLSVALPQNTTCGRARTVRLKLRGPGAEVGVRPGRVYFEEVALEEVGVRSLRSTPQTEDVFSKGQFRSTLIKLITIGTYLYSLSLKNLALKRNFNRCTVGIWLY
uniref:Uncharacterized protein n=1 Tax=Myotis myotis TaxID=51298 RepID=A0A7J8AM93_MYOMY|nr:hypothetical protein mMyoMyo1_008117 [Myotis myotis]